jgi:hypothetical protein
MHLPGTFSTWKALAHNPNVRMAMLPDGGATWPWESMHIEALTWFDRYLKDRDTGITDGQRDRVLHGRGAGEPARGARPDGPGAGARRQARHPAPSTELPPAPGFPTRHRC